MNMENARLDNAARSTQAFTGAMIDGLCKSYDPALIAILACRRDLNTNPLYELGEDSIIRPGKSNVPVYAHPWIFGRNLEIINYCCAALGVRIDGYNGYNRDVILMRTGGRIDINNETDQTTIRELTEYYIQLSTQQIRSTVEPNVQLVTMVGANTSRPITANEFGMQAAKIAGQLPGNCSLREIVDYD